MLAQLLGSLRWKGQPSVYMHKYTEPSGFLEIFTLCCAARTRGLHQYCSVTWYALHL